MPFLKLLLKKMSAKSGAMMQRMPKSSSAQGACSREEPQPKFSCAMMICALRYGSWFSTKSGFSVPSLSIAQRIEQVHAKAGALDGFEEARRDDLVGVDVLHRHRRGDAGQRGEFSMLSPAPDGLVVRCATTSRSTVVLLTPIAARRRSGR